MNIGHANSTITLGYAMFWFSIYSSNFYFSAQIEG